MGVLEILKTYRQAGTIIHTPSRPRCWTPAGTKQQARRSCLCRYLQQAGVLTWKLNRLARSGRLRSNWNHRWSESTFNAVSLIEAFAFPVPRKRSKLFWCSWRGNRSNVITVYYRKNIFILPSPTKFTTLYQKRIALYSSPTDVWPTLVKIIGRTIVI